MSLSHGIRLAAVATAAALASHGAKATEYDAFRIMTFNICHCATHYSLSVTDEDVRRTASVIAAHRPDFVCLQEVDKETTRSAGINQTARIAELLTDATGVRYYGTFGKGREYQGGEFGVAILSTQAPLSVSITPLEGTEPRSLLVCEFADCCVATVHLDTDRDFRTNSIPQIRSAIAAYSKPVLITGDWNATPESDTTLAQMKEFLTVISPESGIRTFGDVDGPDYVIDYIAVDTANADKFYVKRGFCVSNELNGEGTSDHNPVIVDLAVRPDEFKWVEENAVTTGRTGTWSTNVVYDAETLTAEIENTTFTPSATSRGRIATSTFTATFLETWGLPDPDSTAQAAIRLGTNGCFQVWTKAGNGEQGTGNGWVDVAADGVTPTNGVEYTFRVTFDYKAQTYSVEVKSADEWQPLKHITLNAQLPTASSFLLATRGTSISRVKFTGETTFTSLLGEWADKLRGFVLRLF